MDFAWGCFQIHNLLVIHDEMKSHHLGCFVCFNELWLRGNLWIWSFLRGKDGDLRP